MDYEAIRRRGVTIAAFPKKPAGVIGVSVILFLSACSGAGLKTADVTTLELRAATPQELVSHINRDSARVTGIKGKLTMGIQRKPGDSVETCRGVILSENKSAGGRGLYLKGYRRLLPTFFTLVSDGHEFWLSIPRDDIVYTGPVEFSWEGEEDLAFYLKPDDLFRTLYVRPVGPNAVVEVESADSMYVLTVHDEGSVRRTLWLERRQFNVVREIYHDSTGHETLELHRSAMVDIDGVVYPSRFVLHDRIGNSSVFLEFNSLTIDPEIADDTIFRFDIPADVETKHVNNGGHQT